jgi:hypothetical protein
MKTIISYLVCIYGLTVSAQTYELVVLDTSTNESGAYGINSFGYVSGYKFVNGIPTPYLWSPNKGFFQLQKLAGAVSDTGIAYAINDYFEIAGTYGSWSGGLNVYHLGRGTAVVWIYDGATNLIPYQVAQSPAMARDINNNAEVAGQEGDFGFTRNIYSNTGYSAPNNSYCFAVNDLGNATGATGVSSLIPTFVEKQTNGTYTSQTGLDMFGASVTAGVKINTNNQIVGISPAGGFYWEPKTGSNTFFGGSSFCYGINNAGTIVGSTNGRACMWKKDSGGQFTVTDLNQLTSNTNIILEKAFCINDRGQIVGQCLNSKTGVRNAFMLTIAKSVPINLSKGTNTLLLSWMATIDHNYSIHISTDLKTWDPLPDIYWANNTNAWVTLIPDQNKMFFKVFDLTP